MTPGSSDLMPALEAHSFRLIVSQVVHACSMLPSQSGADQANMIIHSKYQG